LHVCSRHLRHLHSFPTRRSSDLTVGAFYLHSQWLSMLSFVESELALSLDQILLSLFLVANCIKSVQQFHQVNRFLLAHQNQMLLNNPNIFQRSEEHTSELQSRFDLVCRLLLEKKKKETIQKNKHTKIDMIAQK